MKELGITKGEWKVDKRAGFNVINQKGYSVASTGGRGSNMEDLTNELQSNAKLIADAGTTANKTGLLPSELLQRYNEAIEVLETIKQSCDEGEIELIDAQYMAIKQTISKAKSE